LVFLYVFSTSCVQTGILDPNPIVEPDKNLLPKIKLFQYDCLYGCWENLALGQSSTNTIREFFNSYVSFNPQLFEENYTVDRLKRYTGMYKDNFNISLIVKNDRLSIIELFGPFNLSLSDILESIKSESYAYLDIRPSATQSEQYDVIFRIFFPNEGYVFDFGYISGIKINLISSNVISFCLEESALVWNIRIVKASTVEGMLQELQPVLFPYLTSYESFFISNKIDSNFVSGCTNIDLNK
jgi:hypothetical protein